MTFKQGFDDFRHLMSFMRPRSKLYYIGVFGNSLTNASVPILLSFVLRYLLDFVVSRDTAELYRAIYLVCGTFLALSILSPICSYAYHRCVKLTLADIRLQLFAHISRLPFRAAESRHSGDLISRMTNDVQTLERAYTEYMRSIILEITMFVSSIVILLALDWRFAMVAVGLTLLSAWLNAKFAGRMREVSGRLQEQTARFTERLSDLLTGLQVVKLFALKGKVGRLCSEASDAVSETGVKQGRHLGLQDACNFFIEFAALGGMLVIGLLMVSSKQMELGTLGQIVQLQTGISAVFLQLGSAVSLMQNSFASLTRIREILDEHREPERFSETFAVPDQARMAASPQAALEFSGVSFGYDSSRAVLRRLNLTVEEGRMTALVGPSGGGKSTVMKLLLGFYPPDEGTLTIRGKSAGHYTLAEIRDFMAYVPQESTLFHGTVADNIRFGSPGASMEEVEAAAKAAYAHSFITELPGGYDTVVGERGANLSGGQRQRLAIARALLKNAPILLLDEATSALDAESEHEVQQAVQALMQGRTTLVIAHRLSTVEQADVICVIADGEVKEKGTHEQLLAEGGHYAELYQLQFRADPAGQPA
ncbi:ABC transporter ATP-binding protein [Paenibacillus tyrfis]|uniref:ABC transporter ATP-binding protein n=1 Tax=Paenibacillus tyrfis TaxID=1501230 RepID=UPI00249085B4|nr:ABC transporter ATP-binding protein [Paenibacillus tyrfis]GLI08026.1 ABC transporter ATP-binding protein [Paenibacillus tyrfis]